MVKDDERACLDLPLAGGLDFVKKSGKDMEKKSQIMDASLRTRIRLYICTTIALWLLAVWIFLIQVNPHSGHCHINNTSQRA